MEAHASAGCTKPSTSAIPRSIAWPLLGMLLAGCLAATVPSQVPLPSGAAPPAAPAPDAAVEAEVHARINQHRSTRGLAALAYDERVASIARSHSRAMAEGRLPFGHDRFEQREAEITRLLAIRSMAENVAYDSRPSTAARAVEGWLASPGHRANIEGAFQATGVGVARAPDGTYFLTQIFVSHR